ncbi:MAG: hypothetical protein AUK34_08870 [Ignavibacteria bacterium CG2_30_36_16]|nr:N-6 DNA methylase [Ignavibacteria bacterium]OIP58580.1 MAG: hypothetical protein AUK34_08870 [Ignavibacteria bacterium CG2_30_36_16]
MSLFQKSVEKKYLNELDSVLIEKKYKEFQDYFGNPSIQKNIRNSNEEQFQEGFLRELFVSILGYTLNPQPNFNLTTELKNIANSKKTDGAILLRGHASLTKQNSLEVAFPIAVIELKGTDTTDLDKIESQAFGYKNHHPKCVYVITSNFEKLRFYIQNAVDHIDFDLFNLTQEQFSLMWLCLAKDNLLNGLPQKIKESSLLQEENITKKLYADYSKYREAIYNNLVENNPETDKLLLFKKTQKLLDRFLFIFFAEDRLLLPPNSISEIVKQWTTLKEELDEYVPLYDRFKKYFGYMNTGYKGKKYDIYAYNGGLFAPDEILDNISIDDDILHKHTLTLSRYDFETDVDVNILGHIFEHSLGEIAAIAATMGHAPLTTDTPLTNTSKRKKDGIFYTPKYITKYIVENTVGKLCDEKRKEFGIVDEEYAKGRKNRKKDTITALDKKLTDYRNWLLSLTILDPACGSGAFLNQALDFLITEHRKIDDLRAQLFGSGLVLSDITTDILEKNIYGVDLNEESVEIAKLSLWLRTAQKGRKLNKLNNNIKCGNSLIDDPEVAGEKAFNWYKEFPNVFKEKEKKIWHVTTATHNSRYSQRMFDNHIVVGEPLWFDKEDEIIITETVRDIAIEDKLNVLEYNICGDHMHILLVCEEEELPKIVGKLKSVSAKIRNRKRGYTAEAIGAAVTRGHAANGDRSRTSESGIGAAVTRGHAANGDRSRISGSGIGAAVTRGHAANSDRSRTSGSGIGAAVTRGHAANGERSRTSGSGIGAAVTRGHAPLSEEDDTTKRGETQRRVWTQKFGKSEIKDGEYLANAIEYIRNNRNKHELPEIKEIGKLKKEFLCTPEHAFRPEYKGGFDVVIGNPPYVVYIKSIYGVDVLKFVNNRFEFSEYNPNTYSLFTELGLNKLLRKNGYLGFIIPNSWLDGQFFSKMRLGVYNKIVNEIVDLKNTAFDEVVETIILLCKNSNSSFNSIILTSDIYNLEPNVLEFDKSLYIKGYNPFTTQLSPLLKKLENDYSKLGESAIVYRGLETRDNSKWLSTSKDSENHIPILLGKDVVRYSYQYSGSYVNFIRKEMKSNANESMYNQPKILMRRTGSSIIATLDTDNYFALKNLYLIIPNAGINIYAILAQLNSRLFSYFHWANNIDGNKAFAQFKGVYIESFPFVNSELSGFKELIDLILEKKKSFSTLASDFLILLKSKYNIEFNSNTLENWYDFEFKDFLGELKKGKFKLSLSDEAEWMQYFKEQKEKTQNLKSEIENIEKEIDQIVYELYGLTEEEIKIVEESV